MILYIIILILSLNLITIASLSIGEKIAKIKPNSKFTKWWRNNVIQKF